VSGKYESFAAVANLRQAVPHLTSCQRVDPGRWLVEKDNRRFADQRYADAQLALVATAEYRQQALLYRRRTARRHLSVKILPTAAQLTVYEQLVRQVQNKSK